ncbi:flagellar brake domain-containing protein [Oceanidesulfovibrio marinus]|uniref:Flagellar brake protein n=1 Tax=Oceanidesulfovibrio marinus TaxID=370038 RepID=A0ABX6NMG0_9BACT|nr:flagellar brake protein [Oceanidesulfovibrio marinus]QJT10870.1 flagellar brake protein [Oceanidesulfovibrio marinus]
MVTSSVERQPGEKLALEIGHDVLIEIQGLGRRFKTIIIGGEVGQYIIVKPPQTRAGLEALLPGTLLTMRYIMSRGRICGFQSEVRQITRKSPRLLFISYPTTFEVLNLRRHDRVHCYQPVTFYVEAQEYSGHILNISTGGCLVTMPPSEEDTYMFAENAEAFLNFRKFESEDYSYVQGRIKKVMREHDHTNVAIEFDTLTDDVRECIESYVNAVYDHLAA